MDIVNRRADALALADEVLADIELGRIEALQIARKSSRLARLLDDFSAMEWLRHEVAGYPSAGPLDQSSWSSAKRSGRLFKDDEDNERARTTSLGALAMEIEAGLAQIDAAADRPISISSSNPAQTVRAPVGNTGERSAVRGHVARLRDTQDRIIGAIHQWVLERHYELRFGRAAETAFAVVRARVDGEITRLVPDAIKTLSTAFENSTSDDPGQWPNAASACRRLIKSVADALRPPGPPIDGRSMTDAHYINRLVDWIVNNTKAKETQQDVIVADLAFMGKRLDAFTDAGHKGAHADVSRYEASRYVTGTYLLLGDILALSAEESGDDVVQEEETDLSD